MNEKQFTDNFNYLKLLQYKMINRIPLTKRENNLILAAISQGFTYVAKPKNFNKIK